MESFDDFHPQTSNSIGVVIVLLAVGLVSVLGGFFYLQSNSQLEGDGPVFTTTPTIEQMITPPESPSVTTMEIVPLEGSESQDEFTEESSEVDEIDLIGTNFKYSRPKIQVKVGELVRIIFKSEGGLHDFVVDELGVSSDRVSTGQSTTIEFTPEEAGTYSFYCSVSNHRSLGMEGVLVVTE